MIVEGGYIRVVQDIRGKYGSQGTYVMNRPLVGNPLNPTKVDDSTDAYDTIDWLVKHVPESNGRVGIIGISYDGYEPLVALVNPHPALKVAVPMNPMVDGWMRRRLVPQRRLPPDRHGLYVRPGGDARQQRAIQLEHTTTSTTRSCAPGRPASSAASTGSTRSGSGGDHRSPRL